MFVQSAAIHTDQDTLQRTPIEVRVSHFTSDLLVLGSKRCIVTGIDSLMP